MNANEFQTLCSRTKPSSGHFTEDLIHAAFGLSTETGEFVDPIKRMAFYKVELDETNLVEELGDILWYVSIAASALKVSLEEIMDKNVAKLKARYPERFTQEKAVTRDLLAERDALESGGE